jgi:hypothetical protein
MKRIFCTIVLIPFLASVLSAQSRITSTILKQSGNFSSSSGRDFWLCINQNYELLQDKFYHVFVTSDRSTTVNFQISGQTAIRKTVAKNRVTTFDAYSNYPGDFPITTEVRSSGIVVPDKAIHVWSDDADISVYLLSSIPYSTDGAYIIPTTGWGKEYIVAAYKDLFSPTGLQDWPSEFAIIVDQDSTIVTITPTWDLRQDSLPHVIQHPRGIPFTEKLNKGECIQYQAIYDTQDPDCDVTGTYITSNNPIGVFGASVAPYLPGPAPLDCCGDFVMDMMQPTRTWSNSYFTCPFANRTVSGDMFLVIGTENGQVIKQNGQQVALVDKFKFTISNYLIDIHGASLWTSDAPFMLVQYMEGQNHNENDPQNSNPSKINLAGDPCSVVINATDLFSKKIIFQIPVINSARTQQNTYTNYVNVFLPVSEESKTSYDSVALNGSNPPNVISKVKFPIGNAGWEAIQLEYKKGLGEGAHFIVSDTGIGVYVYGQGSYESYAWSGNLGIVTPHSPDTIPPVCIVSGTGCFSQHVIVTDNQPNASKLSSIVSDSLFNMNLTVDPSFTPGSGHDSSFYDLHIIDSTIEAYARIFVFDIAGNRTTVASMYQKPSLLQFTRDLVDFGYVPSGQSVSLLDTICNTGSTSIHFASANFSLTNGKKNNAIGFSIENIADQDIPAGGCISFKITLTQAMGTTIFDTLSLLYDCLKISLPLSGNGGQPDFDIGPYTFDCTQLHAGKPSVGYNITNPSVIPIGIDSIWIDDNTNFGFDKTNAANKLPITVPAASLSSDGSHEIIITFSPDSAGLFKTIIHVKSNNIVKRDTIYGLGCSTVSVHTNSYSSQLLASSSEYQAITSQLDHGDGLAIMPPVPNPVSNASNSIRFVFGLASGSSLDLSLYDVLGNQIVTIIHDGYHPAGIFETNFAIPASFKPGSYIYRFSASGKVISGKLVIIR